MRGRASQPKPKKGPIEQPPIGSRHIRAQSLDLVIRAVQLVPGFQIKNAAELLVQAELVEAWILKGKA